MSKQRPFRDRLAEVLKEQKLSLRDIFWVVQAYRAGKQLRRGAYKPWLTKDRAIFFALPGATVRRMIALLQLWGYRPPTPEEALQFRAQEETRVELSKAEVWRFDKWGLGLSHFDHDDGWMPTPTLRR